MFDSFLSIRHADRMLSNEPAIRRIWHGWTTPENADRYETLLTETIVPGIEARGIDGLEGVEVLRAHDTVDGLVEFVTVMSFAGWDAVAAFAGGDGRGSVVPEEARRLLHRFDTHSQHYDVRVH
jgi:hypothetical protein